MSEAKCHVCESTVGVKWQIVEFSFEPDGIYPSCDMHLEIAWSFTDEHPMEASTFDTLEEAQLALVKRQL